MSTAKIVKLEITVEVTVVQVANEIVSKMVGVLNL